MNRAPTMVRPAANEDSTWCCPYLDTGYVVTRSRPYPRQGANEDSTWCCPYLLLQDGLEESEDLGGRGVVRQAEVGVDLAVIGVLGPVGFGRDTL